MSERARAGEGGGGEEELTGVKVGRSNMKRDSVLLLGMRKIGLQYEPRRAVSTMLAADVH